jgi:hypothetical protein
LPAHRWVWLDRAGTLVKVIAVVLGIIEPHWRRRSLLIAKIGDNSLQNTVLENCKQPHRKCTKYCVADLQKPV